MKSKHAHLVIVASLGCILGSTALAQSAAPGTTDGIAQPAQTVPAPHADSDPANSATYATGRPLAGQSKEGFWGKVNPFARKKWVNRQVDPIKDRENELDQLQARNADQIREVDARSQAGIKHALSSAEMADQHAQEARSRADAAQNTAEGARNKTGSLDNTVSNLDRYDVVTSLSVPFAPGHTSLGLKAKAELDDMAAKLVNEKGYLIEVQGYSPSGAQNSQAMADSVVRYLVVEHQVPVYRIYRAGMGKNTGKLEAGEKRLTNGVTVKLEHNSLAGMNSGNVATANPAPSVQGASSSTGEHKEAIR